MTKWYNFEKQNLVKSIKRLIKEVGYNTNLRELLNAQNEHLSFLEKLENIEHEIQTMYCLELDNEFIGTTFHTQVDEMPELNKRYYTRVKYEDYMPIWSDTYKEENITEV